MTRSTLQQRGQVTIPKSVREAASMHPGDIVEIRADGPRRVVIEVIPVKPLEFFWDRFASSEPYDDDAVRTEWQMLAASEAIVE